MMRKVFIALACVAGMAACKNTGTGLQQSVTGRMNEILVVAEKGVWEGMLGDTIRAFFGQDVDGLPQSEPVFDLLNLPHEFFDRNLKSHRNVLDVVISPSADSTTVLFYDSPWARTQKVISLKARSVEDAIEAFEAHKYTFMGVYSGAERDRLVSAYRRTPDLAIYKLFRDKYHLLLSAPTGYYVNKDTAGFVWFSSETVRDSKGVAFFMDEYEHESQFNHVVIIDRVNEMLEKYIPGPLDGNIREVDGPDGKKRKVKVRSYMAIDTEIPYSVTPYTYNGHYAIFMRGLWTVTNDFMAGPFALNVVLDEERGRVIYMMGYVYYPNNDKRNMMKQVEGVMNTMVIDYEEKVDKTKK